MLNVLTLCGLLPEFLNPQNDQVGRACVLDEGVAEETNRADSPSVAKRTCIRLPVAIPEDEANPARLP